MQVCSYCKTRPGLYKFKNGFYCCQPKYQQCPSFAEKISTTLKVSYKYRTKTLMEKLIQTGDVTCYYCDKPAKYYKGIVKGEHRFTCCADIRHNCKGFKKFTSDRMKQRYIDDPSLRIKMSESLKKAQNLPEVKRKKQLSMLHLHNDDCGECKEFKDNFKAAHRKRRTDEYKQNLIYTNNAKRKKLELERIGE